MRKRILVLLLVSGFFLAGIGAGPTRADPTKDPGLCLPASTIPESAAADPSWFSDACVVGHSQAVGMREHMDLPMDYYAISGMRAAYVLDSPDFLFPNGRKGTLRKAMETWSYEKIYVMLGINDCTIYESGVTRFQSAMEGLLDFLKETQPQADICLLSLLPVGEMVSDPDRYSPENAVLYSRVLKSLSREYDTEYLDLYRLMADENGMLRPELDIGDGMHIRPQAYEELEDYLLRHTW